jgi:molecular chaperone GrpE
MSDKEKIKKYEEVEMADSRGQDSMENEQAKVEIDADSVESLQKKLEDALSESQQHYDRLLRVSAEFDNFKKRSTRDADEFRKYANEALLKDLLHVVDNLERAIASSAESSDSNACVVEGVQMTLDEILKIFTKFGVKPIEAAGKPFDPAFHQAIMQQETDEHPDNTIISEMQKGYLLRDRLLRPAMVVVAKAVSPADEKPSENNIENDE